ncbi:MAG: cold-shock protein [Chlamydiales bacterium]
MERGTVKWYDEVKGYGFITSDISKKDLFVHSSHVNNLEKALETGDRVEYDVGAGPKGPQAQNVRLVQE